MDVSDIISSRSSEASTAWELPAWGHPIAQGVFPLFITCEERLFPVGTAFAIGSRIPFIVTAEHNVREMFNHDNELHKLKAARDLPDNIDVRHAGLTVLHNRRLESGEIEFRLWPLELVDGAPPSDIVFGSLRLSRAAKILSFPISLDVPLKDDVVYSVGYAGFRYPDGGIPLNDVKANAFDWKTQYDHRLMVVQGKVERIFTQNFSSSFVRTACFMFDQNIEHAQSGGPVFSANGVVRGINSSGAEMFFDRPASLASLLFPLTMGQLRSVLRVGPVSLTMKTGLLDLIARRIVASDGSEEGLGFFKDELTGDLVAAPKLKAGAEHYTHDDFDGYQNGRSTATTTTPLFRVRRPSDAV